MADQAFMTEDISSWEQLKYPPHGASQVPVAYVKRNIPYVPTPNVLQNLTVYTPIFGHNNKSLAAARDAETDEPGVWLVYIHGGAWRDPRVTAAAFDATAAHVLAPADAPAGRKIAGLASINYSLSANSRFPFSEANPSDERARSAQHPQHVLDVLAGLALLQTQLRFGSRYVLMGHSCGATLALQAGAMAAVRKTMLGTAGAPGLSHAPSAIIGLNGLYDLPATAAIADDYRKFVVGAFGEKQQVWRDASPALARTDKDSEWLSGWDSGKLLVLVQSPDDSLVPVAQMDALVTSLECKLPEGGDWDGDNGSLREQRASNKTLVIEKLTGEHDSVWENGEQFSGIILRTLDKLASM